MHRNELLGLAADRADVTTDIVEASLVEVAEPFELLVDSLRSDARLTAAGEQFTQRWLARILAERVKLRQWSDRDPGVADEDITAPVIVAGAPRTGTTFLHGLLAQHPRLRAPEGWELLFPTPPPEEFQPDDDPRIVAADEELTWPQRQSEPMMSIHRYAARMHKECLSAMSFSFRSEEFVSRYRVPRYADWLRTCDMTPAYAMHRRVLQSLQRRQPTDTWVLKSPVHLNNLPTVLSTYPDARVVITHREPAEVLGSVTSLIVNLRRAFSADVDEVEIARYHLDLYGRSLEALVDADLPADRVAHIDQRELIREPQATVDTLCAALGLASTAVDAAPPAEAGHHDYSLVGVDDAELEATFSRYRERFLAAG